MSYNVLIECLTVVLFIMDIMKGRKSERRGVCQVSKNELC